jgi:hypothetical protein
MTPVQSIEIPVAIPRVTPEELHRERRVFGLGLAGGSPDAVIPTQAPLESAEWQVLRALAAQGIPLTLRHLHLKTGLPSADLQRILARLRTSGSVRRLNTIVESFIVESFCASEAADVERLTVPLPSVWSSVPPR